MVNKFKIGDKVEVIVGNYFPNNNIGKTFIIAKFNNNCEHTCYYPKDDTGVYEPNLKLVPRTWKERFK